MQKKYFFIILLIIFVFILHQSLIANFDWRFNLWPVILVFVLFAFNENLALLWGIVSGFLLDLYSILPFGINLITFFLIIFIIYLLAKNFVTNRSFLSFFILCLIAVFLNIGFLFLAQKLFSWFGNLEQIIIFNWSTIFFQILTNIILCIILYFITAKFTKKLKTDLIISR